MKRLKHYENPFFSSGYKKLRRKVSDDNEGGDEGDKEDEDNFDDVLI